MKMKRSFVMLIAALGMGMTPMAMAEQHDNVDGAYEAAKSHEEAMRKLRQQLEMLEIKEKMASHIYSCQQKGVKCNLTTEGEAPVTYVGGDKATAEQADPLIEASKGMAGMMVRLQPGDPDYIPPVDAAPQKPVEEAVAPEEEMMTEAPVDLESYIEPDYAEPVFFEPAAVAPKLLGIENDEALFMVGGMQARVKGGQLIKETGWKVRDVSFDRVWVKRPDGKSEYLYLNWN